MMVKDLKDCLHDGEIESYQWLPTHEMWADILTKEKKICLGLESALLLNILDIPDVNGERRNKNGKYKEQEDFAT